MEQEPPNFSNWKEAWEWNAREEGDTLGAESEEVLLAQIEAGNYGSYYQVWGAIRKQGTPEKAGPVLLAVLRREVGEAMMLDRVHCAKALFRLLGFTDEAMEALRERVQWDIHGEAARQEALDELERLMEERLQE